MNNTLKNDRIEVVDALRGVCIVCNSDFTLF